MGTNVLIHLHPDFFHELRDVLRTWNKIQDDIEFVGVRPKHDLEVSLLEKGAISDNEATIITNQIRKDTGYKIKSSIIVFTEKRLFDDEYDELFVSGRESDEDPPNIAILSLQFLRKLYADSGKKTLMFKAIVSNILFSLGVDAGLAYHGKTLGCIMDFCNNMSDIEKCLVDGPKFCPKCKKLLKKKGANFLLDLVESFLETPDLESKDKNVTETILLREKMREEDEDSYNCDIALSFSGKDRTYARKLAKALTAASIKVFYDKSEKAKLWGRNLQIYLADLYRLRAKYCVPFLSENYKESRWAKYELQAMLAKEFEANKDYILPIRLDDTEIPGILSTKAYINWQEQPVDDIVGMIRQKLDDYAAMPTSLLLK